MLLFKLVIALVVKLSGPPAVDDVAHVNIRNRKDEKNALYGNANTVNLE